VHSSGEDIRGVVRQVLLKRRIPSARWSRGLCLVPAMASLTACQPHISAEECRALLDHYTERQVEQARPSTNARGRIELQQEAQKKALIDPEFERCPQAVTRMQFDCAMTAHSADQIERCLL
jgi:hypothetical protein